MIYGICKQILNQKSPQDSLKIFRKRFPKEWLESGDSWRNVERTTRSAMSCAKQFPKEISKQNPETYEEIC